MNKDYFKELLEIIDLVPGKGLFKMGKKQISRILKIYKERVIAVIEIIKSHENPFVELGNELFVFWGGLLLVLKIKCN